MKNYFRKISQPDQSRVNEIDQEYAHSRVKGNRKNFWQMLVIMVGFTYFSPSMTAGGHLGLGLNLSQFIIAVILGNLFLAIYTGCLAYIGQTHWHESRFASKADIRQQRCSPSFIRNWYHSNRLVRCWRSNVCYPCCRILPLECLFASFNYGIFDDFNVRKRN